MRQSGCAVVSMWTRQNLPFNKKGLSKLSPLFTAIKSNTIGISVPCHRFCHVATRRRDQQVRVELGSGCHIPATAGLLVPNVDLGVHREFYDYNTIPVFAQFT